MNEIDKDTVQPTNNPVLQTQAERLYVAEHVQLPVCPDCDRIMKRESSGEWKCCAAVYQTTKQALGEYGLRKLRTSEGLRNTMLSRLAGILAGAGIDVARTHDVLERYNLQYNTPPLDAAEVSRVAQSMAHYTPSIKPTKREEGVETIDVYELGAVVGLIEDEEETSAKGVVTGRHVDVTYRVKLADGMVVHAKPGDLYNVPEVPASSLVPPGANEHYLCEACAAWSPPAPERGESWGRCRRRSPSSEGGWPEAGWNDWCMEYVVLDTPPSHTTDVSVEVVSVDRLDVFVNERNVGSVMVAWKKGVEAGTVRGWEGGIAMGFADKVEAFTDAGEKLLLSDNASLLESVLMVANCAADVDAGKYTTRAD